jgi:hypothetical protein
LLDIFAAFNFTPAEINITCGINHVRTGIIDVTDHARIGQTAKGQILALAVEPGPAAEVVLLKLLANLLELVPMFGKVPRINTNDAEVEGSRLTVTVLVASLFIGNTGGCGNIAVTGGVNHDLRGHSLGAVLCLNDNGPYVSVLNDTIIDKRMKYHLHPFFFHELVKVYPEVIRRKAMAGIFADIVAASVFKAVGVLDLGVQTVGGKLRARQKPVAGFNITGGDVSPKEPALFKQHG